MTVVVQLQTQGILRTGSVRSGFRYRYATGGRMSPRHRGRIERLRIPPAWTDVAIDRSPDARIQAVGQDAAGRWQYVYHTRAVERRERNKFRRLVRFTRSMPRLRQRVALDIRRRDGSRDQVLGCMLRVLSTCFLRPGSEEYAAENGSYGIATLRSRHVDVRGLTVRLHFNGKSGKEHIYEISDRHVARTVRMLKKTGRRRLFAFRDESGEWRDVRRQHINTYIKEVMGSSFSAKDFRTWAGTITCACMLARTGVDSADSAAARRKKVASAVQETADLLGNTPAVSRSSYICPRVISAYERGQILSHAIADVSMLGRARGSRLHRCERALLRLLEQSAPSSRRTRGRGQGAA
jgi:DNA topoisomerase-1